MHAASFRPATIDRALVTLQQCRRGDCLSEEAGAALSLLYEEYAPFARRTARAVLATQADADDVVHDVFLALPHALARYQPGNFAGWLRRVVLRAATAHRRRSTRMVGIGDDALIATLPSSGADATSESDMLVRDAVDALPASMRPVVVLRLFEDLSHQAIAQRLGISVASSEIRLCRALKLLRARLSGGQPVAAIEPAARRPASHLAPPPARRFLRPAATPAGGQVLTA